MIYTNNHNLPKYIYDILSHEWYGGSNAKHDFSVTQVGNPVGMTILQNRHKDEVSEDIMDSYVRALGTGFHLMCEEALKGQLLTRTEERLYIELEGKVISGQYDLYLPAERKLVDYKVTKATTYIFGGRADKYSSQMNTNRYILAKNGYSVDSLEIVELYRDWDKATSKADSRYPSSPINILPIEVVALDTIERKLRQYIAEYSKFENTPDNELPYCSAEDRWERNGGYAVMQKGKARAQRVLKSEREANLWLSEKGLTGNKDYYIDHRPATPIRCIDWCSVNKWCPFYRNYANIGGESNVETKGINEPECNIFKDLF